MDSFLIRFVRKRGRAENLVEMPSMEKLLKWIEKNGPRCSMIHITVVQEVFE